MAKKRGRRNGEEGEARISRDGNNFRREKRERAKEISVATEVSEKRGGKEGEEEEEKEKKKRRRVRIPVARQREVEREIEREGEEGEERRGEERRG